MNDAQYISLFQDTMKKIIEVFDPSVIVLQCGADSLVNDKLGNFNLSSKGKFMSEIMLKNISRL
jgi:histone deacetylase 1/2